MLLGMKQKENSIKGRGTLQITKKSRITEDKLEIKTSASLAKRCCYFVRKGTNYNINNKRKRKEKTLIIR